MTRRQQRLYGILVVMLGISLATALTLMALRSQVTYFYSPSDLTAAQPAADRTFRLGGLVVPGSVTRSGQIVRFTITDNEADRAVVYEGIVPSLFREGQGIIATGSLSPDGTFSARQLLAKHDENYMPPEVARSLRAPPDTAPESIGPEVTAPDITTQEAITP